VFFGTDRQPIESNRAVFANAPTPGPGELSVGACEVSIPTRVHRLGNIERPTVYTLHMSDWFENPNRHFVITDRSILDAATFWHSMARAVSEGREQQVLLFIHGYNVSFDDAIYRTAQLAYDLQFAGVPVLYSWPSDATALRYVADRDHSLSTLAAFENFLLGLSRQSRARTIHIVAHSMGNNALVHALAELARDGTKQPAPHFREIIMAAPDVDRREFLRLGEAFQSTSDHITLYAADNDRAIGASDTLSGEPRVGDANPMFLRRGIDSIDASAVIKGFLKHSYFAESRILLDDIQRVLELHASPPRFGLAGIPRDDRADYWRFVQ
jgi:esterase/lipase superfamily enzyme